MAEEEKEESLVDTVTAAVAEHREAVPDKPEPETAAQDTEPVEEQPKEEEGAKQRDAQGRFKSKAEPEEDGEQPKDQPQEPQEAVRPDITRPPKRLPIRTKGVWQTLSPELREDIWAREQEFDNAFKRYDGLGNYAMQAEKNGSNLQTVVRGFAELEDQFRKDPILGGVLHVWQRLGIDANTGIRAFLERLGVPGQQAPQTQQQGVQQTLRPEDIDARFEQKLLQREVDSKIRDFINDPRNVHLRNEVIEQDGSINLGESGPFKAFMVRVLSPDPFGNPPLAKDLEDAYDMACRHYNLPARPSGNAANAGIKTAAVDRSRAANKATVGAPSQGSNAGQKTPLDGNLDVFDTVRAAVARQRGS